ncbi:accessory regulator AgrB [Romboutsia ilealis]|uniref:Accessory gene regulator B family protein n=1 Tax=Romboutsia faecis TaxID=2764597 RepID=A0ABR7JPG3_9FIRM|nr:accessory gene regulator B family protein [Romboutsia faecis]MBC5996795.1 accessory gene regulator B family protein [Romboutsia faecis]MRN24749.1 accessory regulator AgrB [Romboutsia ilealis]
MLRKKLDHFVEEICKYNNFTQDKTEEIQYVMRLMMYEVLKIITIIIMFSILGYSKEVVLIIFTMICVKPFTGGYHETSQKRCLIATTMLCCLTILMAKNSNLNLVSTILISIINIFCIYHQAPIVNKCMPITKLSLIKKNNRIALINYIILSMISIFIIKYRVYSNIIIWTLTINVCLMFNSKKHGEVQ